MAHLHRDAVSTTKSINAKFACDTFLVINSFFYLGASITFALIALETKSNSALLMEKLSIFFVQKVLAKNHSMILTSKIWVLMQN